jgi:hypothetical protein
MPISIPDCHQRARDQRLFDCANREEGTAGRDDADRQAASRQVGDERHQPAQRKCRERAEPRRYRGLLVLTPVVLPPAACQRAHQPFSDHVIGAANEQYAAWHIYKGGPQVLRQNATLTRSDLIKFGS